jgi:hypothetical protein
MHLEYLAFDVLKTFIAIFRFPYEGISMQVG